MKKQFFLLVALLCLAGLTTQAQQRLVLVEEFTSSTCPPCAPMNAWLNPLLVTNADKVVVVKYQMNWPAQAGFPNGDPYYTAEGGVRRTYYGVNAVPDLYIQGTKISGSQTAVQNAINNGYAQPAQATITGTFSVSGNNITINGSVTPSISGSGHKLYVIVNEKRTTQNKDGNGEQEFFHIMMKMFPNGSGQDVTLTSGTAIPFSHTYDMSSTHVEEMDDLEVLVFVQNVSTKAILNAAYMEDLTPAPQNVTASQAEIDNLNVNITWGHPSGVTPDGYNVYRNGVKLNTSLVTGTSFQDVAPEYAKTYEYGVGIVIGGVEGYRKKDMVLINVTMPVPVLTTVKQTRGLKMLVEWEADTQYPVKFFVYRSGIAQNPPGLTTLTSIINTGLSYREYCFQIEPILNEITGAKSSSVCVTLIDVPQPKNVKAQQVSSSLKEVRLTWDDSPSPNAGYNIYRDDVLINTELVTTPTYLDVVAEFGVEYTYQVYGVADTGAESEKSGTAKITLSESNIPAPNNVQAIQEGGSLYVAVTWDAVTMSGVEGYNIYRDGVKLNGDLVTEAEYLDNVPAEDTYCYVVVAVIEGMEGDRSESVCVEVKLDISEIKDAWFTVYPNPVSNTLNISTNEIITDCQIFNIHGQLIYSTQSNIKEITTDNWNSGVYIIRVTTEKGTAEKRFVKN